VREWETAAAAPRDVVLQHGDPAFVYRGYLEAFSPDSRRVVTGSDDQTAAVWDAATGRPITPPLRHDGAVNAAVFSPDGRRVATASGDGAARIWDAASGQLLARTTPHGGIVYDVEFSPDGRRIVTAAGGSVRAVFSPDGRRVVSTGDGPSRVWDAQTGRPISLCGSPAGGKNAVAFIWDPVSGRLLAPPLPHQGMACDAEFSPDGRRVVTASFDWTARVWDAATGKPVTPPLRHTDMGLWANFSPDGRRVVTASMDGTARVWDAGTGRPITSPLPHYRGVHASVFSPDGRAVATAAEDGAARLWDAATGQPITPPLPSAGGDSGAMNALTNVAFSPDGRRLLTAGTDGTTHIWTLTADPRAPADLLRLAQLLTGSRVDASGGVVPLAPATLVRAWQALHAQYPGDFETTAAEVLAWRQQEAGLCERAQRWGEVVQHLTSLISAEPWNESLRVRRARAAAKAD
jgi:WD40 repeat protein